MEIGWSTSEKLLHCFGILLLCLLDKLHHSTELWTLKTWNFLLNPLILFPCSSWVYRTDINCLFMIVAWMRCRFQIMDFPTQGGADLPCICACIVLALVLGCHLLTNLPVNEELVVAFPVWPPHLSDITCIIIPRRWVWVTSRQRRFVWNFPWLDDWYWCIYTSSFPIAFSISGHNFLVWSICSLKPDLISQISSFAPEAEFS